MRFFEFDLCNSKELQQGSRIDISNFTGNAVVQSGSGIHKQSVVGKLPSNVNTGKILQLNCYCIAFRLWSKIMFPKLKF